MTKADFFQKIKDGTEEQIKKGGRLTLVYISDWGCTCTAFIKAGSVEISGFAQYKNGVKIIGTKKGGRTRFRIHLHEGMTFALFSGWVKPSEGLGDSWECCNRADFYRIADSVTAPKIGENSERTTPKNTEKPIYRVVTESGCAEFCDVSELLKKHETRGIFRNEVCRRELQGAPLLEGLVGPMYDGTEAGRPVLRYESKQIYEILSR